MRTKRYSITNKDLDRTVVAYPDKKGHYRAISAAEIENALNILDYKTSSAEVLIGNTWVPLRRVSPRRTRKRVFPRKARPEFSELSGEPRPAPFLTRLLVKVGLKSPLELLIYRGEKSK